MGFCHHYQSRLELVRQSNPTNLNSVDSGNYENWNVEFEENDVTSYEVLANIELKLNRNKNAPDLSSTTNWLDQHNSLVLSSPTALSSYLSKLRILKFHGKIANW